MSTRSTIALEYADGSVHQIYCHSDGYLSYNGKVLMNHWMDPFKVRELMDHGDLSMLGAEIGVEIDFNDRMDYTEDNIAKQCRFYGRDRGETGVKSKKFVDFQDYLVHHNYEEYEYILRQDGQWWVNLSHNLKYVPLATAMEVETA